MVPWWPPFLQPRAPAATLPCICHHNPFRLSRIRRQIPYNAPINMISKYIKIIYLLPLVSLSACSESPAPREVNISASPEANPSALQEVTPPALQEANTPAPREVPSPANPEEAANMIREGMSYAKARAMLKSGGWQVGSNRRFPPQDPGVVYEYAVGELGYEEYCTYGNGGTVFLFRDHNNRYLEIYTGEYIAEDPNNMDSISFWRIQTAEEMGIPGCD